MKRLLCVLLALGLVFSLAACGGSPVAPEETTAEPTTTIESEITTEPYMDEPEEPMQPSYIFTDTHFYALTGGLLYAPLDNLSQVRRIPLPVCYGNKWLGVLRIDEVNKKWITLTAQTGDRYTENDEVEIAYVQMRIALDTFLCEFLSESDTLPSAESIAETEKPPYSDAENAWFANNANIVDIVTLDGKSYCMAKKEDDEYAVCLFSLENGVIVDNLIPSIWIGGIRVTGGKLALLNNMIVWIDSNERVLILYDPTSEKAFCGFDYEYRLAQNETRPRPDYEFTYSYAKTPTHIFASRDGELYRMPLNNIAKQEKINLPKKYANLAISGLTEQWLYVSGGRMDEEDERYLQHAVTYRISLKTLDAKQVGEGETSEWPRYNVASNSLLYVCGQNVEALSFDTGKRDIVFDFIDYHGSYLNACVRGWFNTPEGEVVLEIMGDWWDGPMNCVVFGKDNTVRMRDGYEFFRRRKQPEHMPTKAEQDLEKRNDIATYVACGEYIYYVQETGETDNYRHVKNLYRMKLDGSDKKLLRAKTNIFELMAVNGKIICLASLPNNDFDQFGFYALDEDGKVAKTISQGYDGEWGGSGWERFGDLIMFSDYFHGSAESTLLTLYDPATTATFHAYTKDGN